MSRESEARPWTDFQAEGLLWLVNASVFHPRGYALAFCREGDEITGWKLLGDGTEPWRFGDDVDPQFLAAEALFTAHKGEVGDR